MTRKDKFIYLPVLIFAALIILLSTYIALTTIRPSQLTVLRDGDIILQTSLSNQAMAIMLASHSVYTHIGIVKNTDDGMVVVEGTSPVKETPIDLWVHKGLLKRFTVKRLTKLDNEQTSRISKMSGPITGALMIRIFCSTMGNSIAVNSSTKPLKALALKLERFKR